MRVLVAGGDGFCGWPTALRLSARGHEVFVADNLSRRRWDGELGTESLTRIHALEERVARWKEMTGRSIGCAVGDLTDERFVYETLDAFRPEALVHYAEQRSAPYSMIDRSHAVFTQVNNVVGTLNLLFAIGELVPDCHLIKLGTMGEYGTPNIDIEEGYIQIEHNGRRDTLPYPKQPGSFYHLCYDDQTEVLTRSGWKLFKEVTEGDEVATRQLDSAWMTYEKPTALMSYYYEGPMYCVEQRRLDLCVTPNHRMVTSYERRDGSEKLRFEAADGILHKYNRYHLTCAWEGGEAETFILPSYYYLEGGYVPRWQPAAKIPMDDWLRFLGWYIAEGTLDRGRRKAPNRINVNQKIGPKSDRVAAVFRRIAEILECTYSAYPHADRDQVGHYLYGTQLAVYLQQLGMSFDKHVPRELLSLSRRQLRILFDALMDGDGTWMDREKQYGRYYTSSRRLADGVQEIALKLGLSANVSRFGDDEYRVNISRTTVFQVNQQADDPNDWLEDYAGMVYCCEVPGDGILLVRRGGKPVWCGNSKVHDSHNIMFVCRSWGLRATDLNQGVVYNVQTAETASDPVLANRYDYDGVFGTALNRFCAQAASGNPITVYGEGGQTRGFIDVRDTVRCIELAANNPPEAGEFRVFNQFTEQWSVLGLARLVEGVARALDLDPELVHLDNPRVEKEEHYYNAANTSLLDLGLKPHLLNEETVERLLLAALENRDRIHLETFAPQVSWRRPHYR